MIRLVQAASPLRADDPLHHTVARRADLPPRMLSNTSGGVGIGGLHINYN